MLPLCLGGVAEIARWKAPPRARVDADDHAVAMLMELRAQVGE